MSSRKSSSVLSVSIQTLLRADGDVVDGNLFTAHIGKKVEAAVHVIRHVPGLRGVALEVISSAIIHLSTSNLRDDSALHSSVSVSCDMLASLLDHAPQGWADTLFEWSVSIVARISSSTSCDTSNDIIRDMLNRPFIHRLILFIEDGLRYKRNQGVKNVINDFLQISDKESTNIGWLIAHIVSHYAELFPNQSLLKDHTFNATPSPSSISSFTSCLDMLVKPRPQIVSCTLTDMMEHLMSSSSSSDEDENDDPINVTSSSMHVMLELLSHCSLEVIHLVVKDVLSIVSSKRILMMVSQGLERNDDTSSVGSNIIQSLVGLLTRLDGHEATLVINKLLECVLSYTSHEDDDDEDGEINPLTMARIHLLDIIHQLLNVVVSATGRASSLLMLGSSSHSSGPLVQYTISLQHGLHQWIICMLLHSFQNVPDNIATAVIGLIVNVGMCSCEVTAANIVNQILLQSHQVQLVLSLLEKYSLPHPNIIYSVVIQGVTDIMNYGSKHEKWFINLHRLANDDQHIMSSKIKSAISSTFKNFLQLLPSVTPTSALHISDLLCLACQQFTSESPSSIVMSSALTLIHHYITLLNQLANAIATSTDYRNDHYIHERLMKIRLILSIMSRHSSLIESVVCSRIIHCIISKGSPSGCVNPSDNHSLLSYNSQFKGSLHISYFNTRQVQHSDSLYCLKVNKSFTEEQSILVGLASSHCSDQVIWLINDVINASTNQIASSLMDEIAPNSLAALSQWPDIDYSTYTTRQSFELHLDIKRKFSDHPILWKILLLISTSSDGMIKCSSLIHSLMVVLIWSWKRNRSLPSSLISQDLLYSSISIIGLLGKGGWLSRPLSYVGELFNELTCEEVSLLMELCYHHIKNNYDVIMKGHVTQDSFKNQKILLAILRKNIKKFGHVYFRFVSSQV